MMVIELATDSGARWFRVETGNLTPLPRSFSARSAEVFYWHGHLLVMVPQEKRALLFSLRDVRPVRPLPWIKQDLGPVHDGTALDALLAGYEVTRVPTATMIASSQGVWASTMTWGELERGRMVRKSNARAMSRRGDLEYLIQYRLV